MNHLIIRYVAAFSMLFVTAVFAEAEQDDSAASATGAAATEAAPSSQKIYKKVGKDGRVIYSSTGAEDEQVDVRETNTISLPELIVPPQVDKAALEYESIVITEPENGAVIDITGQDLPVQIAVKAALIPALNTQAGHRLQFYVNGSKAGEPVSSGQFVIEEVYRGTYAVEAAVVDNENEELIRSEPIEFTARQHAMELPSEKPANGNNKK